jgi:ABC-2 type transport system ATP-binding protein
MRAAENNIIRTSNLTRRFGELTAVERLDLDIAAGEIFGLVGPDAAGKTTTLRLLCGLLDATEGQAWVAGLDVAREPDAVKDRIGYMAQRFGLYADLTVEENMVFYADLFGLSGRERRELMPGLLRMTRMEPFRDRPAGKLSGGMKQKLSLMCTLLHKPEVLFLDEPTNGVDPVSRRDFWVILYRLVRDGLTVLITTAYLDEAERCDRIGLMHEGRIVRCDTPHNLRRGMVEPCFNVACSDPRTARTILSAHATVLSAEPAGAELHVFLREGESHERARAAIDDRLGEASRWQAITPGLEDVFIAVIRKAQHAGAEELK